MLKNPHPAAPSAPGRYCLRFQHPNGKRMIQVWAALYAAHVAAVAVLGPPERWRWQKRDEATGRHGLGVRCDALERIAEYALDEEESAWELPEPYASEIAAFKRVAR